MRRKKIIDQAQAAPIQQVKQFAQQMSELLGKPLSPKIIKSSLRRGGMVWKRLRNSLKQQRDPVLYAFFEAEMAHLKQMAYQTEIDLYYLDETGLHLNPHVPYAWQPKNTTALLPAQRGRGRTIVGIFSPIKQDLKATIFEGAVNADCIIAVIDQFAQQVNRKTLIVLDRATIHTAKKVMDQCNRWKKMGVYLQFLPAYSPELNLIEILWKHLKHFWLELHDYQSIDTLTTAAAQILASYGKHYAISFG
ncbi:MAG: IS630 family transposase [Bacteroidota bacterium]